MQYWLRRNNVDRGPFNKEALLSQGLNTGDLVKIEGDSDWKSPADFAELSQSVPKPKYKFTADKQLIEIKDQQPAKPGENAAKAAAPAGPSPFKRVPSALPKKKPAVTPPVDNTGVNATEKAKERTRQLSRAEKPPDPGQGAVTPTAEQTQQKTPQKVHPQIQNLDDAPLRETRHHPSPKPVRTAARSQNSNFLKEFFLPILIIGGIGFLAWWGYKKFTSPSLGPGFVATSQAAADTGSESGELLDTQSRSTDLTDGPAAIPMQQNSRNAAKTSVQPSAVQDSSKADKNNLPAAKATKTIPTTASKSAAAKPATEQDSSTDKNIAKAPAVKQAATPEKKADTPVTTTAKGTPESKDNEPAKKTSVAKSAKATSIADYISLSLNKAPEPGIKNIKIKVQNTSQDDLNIAVVEIKYFDKAGKFIQGETLQTGKINAGKSTTIKIPSSRGAERISYKVSLISGDNVYLMGR